MMTVATYAETRGRSESTVKGWIKKLELELPINPADRRQRLISNDHQALLDAHGKVKASSQIPAAVDCEILEPVPTYQRSPELSVMIAEGAVIQAQASLTQYNASQNPLLQALQQQVQQLETRNAHHNQEINLMIQTQQESQQAIAAIDRMRIAQAAKEEAFQEFQLKKQLKQDALNNYELQARGLAPVNQTPEPTPQPRPQSQPLASQPSWL